LPIKNATEKIKQYKKQKRIKNQFLDDRENNTLPLTKEKRANNNIFMETSITSPKTLSAEYTEKTQS